jgi:hypothetical protein
MGCVVRLLWARRVRPGVWAMGVVWRGLGVVWVWSGARVGGWVGFEGVRFVRFVCLSRVCPGSPRCLFTAGTREGSRILRLYMYREGEELRARYV